MKKKTQKKHYWEVGQESVLENQRSNCPKWVISPFLQWKFICFCGQIDQKKAIASFTQQLWVWPLEFSFKQPSSKYGMWWLKIAEIINKKSEQKPLYYICKWCALKHSVCCNWLITMTICSAFFLDWKDLTWTRGQNG